MAADAVLTAAEAGQTSSVRPRDRESAGCGWTAEKRSIREKLMNWMALSSKSQEVFSGQVASIARYIKCFV